MYTYLRKSRKAASAHRATAIFFTILFHVVLIGGIAYSTGADMEKYTPEIVKEWLGMEKEAPATANVEEGPRP